MHTMGAPKQRWKSEEEAALKAGIQKYGIGKWSAILKDVEFSIVLRARSNVDLKDKWRNLTCMTSGLGSRSIARASSSRSNLFASMQDDDDAGPSTDVSEVPVTSAASGEIPQDAIPMNVSRLDHIILEAIARLKEPRGSCRPAIAGYIEDHYSAPPELDGILAEELKTLTDTRRLIKHRYRIAPTWISFGAGEGPAPSPANDADPASLEAEGHGIECLTKAMIDAQLDKIRKMSPEDAAQAAAWAVVVAEAVLAEAEAAAKEAEEAEADVEAALCFADLQKSMDKGGRS